MGRAGKLVSEAYVAVKGLIRYRGVLFWAVVFPILFYSLMVAIWGGQGVQAAKLGVVDNDRPVPLPNGTSLCLGDELVEALNDSGLFHVYRVRDRASLEDLMRHGKLDVGLVTPGNFTESIVSMRPATVEVVALNTSDGRVQASVLEGFLNSFSDSVRARSIRIAEKYAVEHVPDELRGRIESWFQFVREPVRVEADMLTPPLLATPGGVKAFYALGMIGVEILFIGLSIGVTSIIDMKREGTLKVILSAPMSPVELLASFTLAGLVMVGVSAASILVYSLVTGAEYSVSPGTALTMLALLVLSALFTIGFGLLLAPLARSQEAAMALVNIVAFPVMFVGGLVIPSFVLPPAMREFASVYPLSRLLEAVRGLLLYGVSPRDALWDAMPAAVATLAVYILGMIVFVRLLERAVEE